MADSLNIPTLAIVVAAAILVLLKNQYYNLRYNPSAPFVRSGFLVSYRIRSAMKTTAPRTAPHLTYIQGIGIPNKASFEILTMNTGLN